MAQMDNKCPVCGSSFVGRSKHCSESCKMKAKRKAATADKLAFVRHSPLVETILRNAVRSGTLAVIAGVNLFDLNRAINRHRDLCWRTGSQLHISHYIASTDRGSLHPSNLGAWPAWLNFKQGKKSLPIGHSISDRHWHDSSLFVSNEDDAWRILLKKHRKTLIELASREPASPDDILRKPARQDAYKRLRKAGCKHSFATVHRLDRFSFEKLCQRYKVKIGDMREPNDDDRVSIPDLLKRELYHQRQHYPQLTTSIEPVIAGADKLPDWMAVNVLALAVTHNYSEAMQLMTDYVPNKPVIKHQNDGERWTVEIHTWKGDDGKWHQTEVPHPDFYKHNKLEF